MEFFSLLILAASVAALHSEGIEALNASLHGAVQAIEPFALPCFSSFNGKPHARQDSLCSERQARYLDPLYRREIPGAYMYDTSSINASDPTSEDQCLLDLANPSNPAAWQGKDCKLGNLPTHYVTIHSACDAMTVFRYAAKFDIRLSIKNSGHTYLEDASGAGSLLLWTRKLQRLRYEPRFVPTGSSSAETFNAVTMGAGVSCGEAYEFADSNGVTVLCGYSPTVGISGGWVQNGGHSVLSNVYGLGVDRVVQFKIVTPDGQLRIANKHQNSDLFWALRGGGGGTFGLVIETTQIVEPNQSMAVALIEFPSNIAAIGQFMDLLVDSAIVHAEDGWGGHIYGNKIIYISPKIKTTLEAKLSLVQITTFARRNGGSSNITMSPTWYKFFQDFVLSSTYSVGNLQLIGTQLAPTDLFKDATKKSNLKRFFRDELAKGNIPYIPVDSPYLRRGKHLTNETSVHPIWYDSLWEIGIGARFMWNSTLEQRRSIIEEFQRGSNSLAKLTGGAAYKNEANPFTNDWKTAWYGGHYDALLRIKFKYDPLRLLRCWGCVGWTKEDAEQSSYRAFTNITGH